MSVNYFDEFSRHLLEDEKPSLYFRSLDEEGFFNKDYPFNMLGALKQTEQNPKWHPEGNVWNHTMNVVDNGALLRDESQDKLVFMWSTLLHDIGKPDTTKVRKGKITAYNHDKVGEELSIYFLRALACDADLIYSVSKMARWHMQVLMVIKNLPYADIKTMVNEVPVYEIALLAMCDRLGRGEVTKKMLDEEKKAMEYFLNKCKSYTSPI